MAALSIADVPSDVTVGVDTHKHSHIARAKDGLGRHLGQLEIETDPRGYAGIVKRLRLNRGGDRQANAALHQIVLIRLRYDEATKAYFAKRKAEGKSKNETFRCLKRYVAREVYRTLVGPREEAIRSAA